MPYMLTFVSTTLTLMQGQVDRQRQAFSVELFRQLNKQQALNLLQPVGYFLRDLDFANVYMDRPTCFFIFSVLSFSLILSSHPLPYASKGQNAGPGH